MTLGDILALIEIFLLIWVVIQGEYVRFYERGVYRIQSEREKERKEWREEKRKAVRKKQLETVVDSNIQSADSPIAPMVGQGKE